MENEVVNNETVSAVPEKKGFSIASMVMGLVGLFFIPILFGILAIVFSVVGKKQGGKGFAIAGLVMGIIDVAYGAIVIINSLILLATVGSII